MSAAILKGVRVLYVEDEILINVGFAEMMEEMGCIVTSCTELDAARKAVAKAPPELAVLDVNIHGQMSYELAKHLEDLKVPVVFLTGYDQPELKEQWKNVRWSRLSEQIFRVDKWSLCRV